MSSWSWKAGLAGVALLAATAYAAAQMSGHPGMTVRPWITDESPQGAQQMHAYAGG